jgi:hypothetical protein
MSVDQGEVFLFRLADLQAHGECARGIGVFAHEHEAAGLAIEAGDDGRILSVPLYGPSL